MAPQQEPRKILIVLPTPLGDTVMATPALLALRKHFPQSLVTFLGRKVCLEALQGGKLCDAQIEYDPRAHPRIRNLLALAKTLRPEKFDRTILFPNSFRSAVLARLGKAGRVAGYARDGRGLLLHDKIAPARDKTGNFAPTPTIQYYLGLAALMGVKSASRQMTLATTPQGEKEALAYLASARVDPSRPLVILNPGASFGPSKVWPAERFAAVADTLAVRHGAAIILNVAPDEQMIGQLVEQSMHTRPAISFAQRPGNMAVLKSLVKRSRLMITNDTGLRHFAAAFGINLVTIFGSTNPEWARIDYPNERILRPDVTCAPCQKKVCPHPPGPTFHQCMTTISIEQVLAAAVEMLKTPLPGSPRP